MRVSTAIILAVASASLALSLLLSSKAHADIKEPTPWGVYRDDAANEQTEFEFGELSIEEMALIYAAIWCEEQGFKGDADCIASKSKAELDKLGGAQ